MKRYVVINNLVVGGYHALAGLCVSGLPSMSALTGFARAFAMKLEQLSEGETAQPDGIALAILSHNLFGGHERFIRYGFDEREFSKSFEAPTVDRQKGNLVGSLILRLHFPGDGAWLTDDLVRRVVVSQRLAGGVLQPGPFADDFRIHLADSRESALRRLPATAFLIRDYSMVLADRAAKDGLPLDAALLRLIARRKHMPVQQALPETPAASADPDANYPGYALPVAAGFHLLETPATRAGSRLELPHAFAETLLTAARAQLVASVRAAIRLSGEEPEIFWRETWDPHSRDIRITATF